jgi:hypothetical protein
MYESFLCVIVETALLALHVINVIVITNGRYTQKWIAKLYSYEFVCLDSLRLGIQRTNKPRVFLLLVTLTVLSAQMRYWGCSCVSLCYIVGKETWYVPLMETRRKELLADRSPPGAKSAVGVAPVLTCRALPVGHAPPHSGGLSVYQQHERSKVTAKQ